VDEEILTFLSESCDIWVLTKIIDKFHEGIIAVDASGRIFYVNEAYSQILGVAKHNVLGKQLQKIEPSATVLEVLEKCEPILGKAVYIKSLKRHVVVNIHPIKRDGSLVAVVSIFRDVTETKKLSQALDKAEGLAEYFRTQLEQDGWTKKMIIGKSQSFVRVLSQAMIVAKTDATVLIGGENGVGKEVITKAIHENSSRSEKQFICVNCAAIPETLLESELFGYEEGAFTNAKRGGKLGKFELAEGGTIFLDEIGDMSPIMQSKLLRVLQEKEIEKIGRSKNIPIDVRVLAATNRSLEAMVKQGTFRNDLYYRLNVVAIQIPPLRERDGDIALLAQHFLLQNNKKYNKKLTISSEVLRFFYQYNWPGNVRELQNCIEYAVIMCTEQEFLLDHLPPHMSEAAEKLVVTETVKPIDVGSLREMRHTTEKELIKNALVACKNNKSEAMKMLGISRRAFYIKLKEHGYM